MHGRQDLTTHGDCVGHITIDYKIPLILTPQPEGGFIVTSSALPELVTEGDSVSEALAGEQ